MNTIPEQLPLPELNENTLKSLIYRLHQLDEEHSTVLDDNTWDNFQEWENLTNWIEGQGYDYLIDSDGGIHLYNQYQDTRYTLP